MLFSPRGPQHRRLGYADFFSTRYKRKMLRLAEIKPIDIFYDLGCGDASILILAVTEFGIKKAIGIESDPKRFGMARKNVERAELSDAITIEKKDMFRC